MSNTNTPSLGVTLLGKTREAVIGLLFTAPEPALHVREIARRTGFSAPTVARELRLLEAVGVLVSRLSGRQLEFKANASCPLFPELKSIAVKTWGVRGRIAAALDGLHGIECAFVFGSFASGSPHPGSDIDLLVIGSLDLPVLSEACSRVESDVGRTVSAKLYRHAEWSRKLAEGNEFIASVAAGPKLFVVGDEGTLDAIGKPGAARRTTAAKPPLAYAQGGRKPPSGRARVPARRKSSGRA
jgi:predicted nucleotidyltransferase